MSEYFRIREITSGVPVRQSGAASNGAEAGDVLHAAAATADDLLAYRHATIHGALIPSGKMPMLIRNPGWYGEKRRRESNTAYLSTNLLDMAIATVWALGRIVRAALEHADGADEGKIIALHPEVVAARSMAIELRHLAAINNSEKN